jgi:hypothetical protein
MIVTKKSTLEILPMQPRPCTAFSKLKVIVHSHACKARRYINKHFREESPPPNNWTTATVELPPSFSHEAALRYHRTNHEDVLRAPIGARPRCSWYVAIVRVIRKLAFFHLRISQLITRKASMLSLWHRSRRKWLINVSNFSFRTKVQILHG